MSSDNNITISTCMHCKKPIVGNVAHYGLHPDCFRSVFECEEITNFSNLSQRRFTSDSKDQESPYLSSFFAGNYRKYDAQLNKDRYILKFQEKDMPELVVVEYVSNKIAQCFNIPVPTPFAIILINDEWSFAVRNFLNENAGTTHNLVHIYHYLVKGDENYTVINIYNAIQRETKNLQDCELFLTTLLFDALIGNDDRHGRNLALLQTAKSKKLSLIYDNVSALGRQKGSWLEAHWSPKGKIYTRHSKEPVMRDYIQEINQLGHHNVLKKFRNHLVHDDINSVIHNTSMLSKNMQTALLALINERTMEFLDEYQKI